MMDLFTPEALIALLTLTSLEVVMGIDNVIFIMIAAIAISVVVMLAFSRAIVTFIERHPALKILALAFLLLIGTLLVAEGFHQKIPKGYVYFAMAVSLGVDLLQMRATRSKEFASPVG